MERLHVVEGLADQDPHSEDEKGPSWLQHALDRLSDVVEKSRQITRDRPAIALATAFGVGLLFGVRYRNFRPVRAFVTLAGPVLLRFAAERVLGRREELD